MTFAVFFCYFLLLMGGALVGVMIAVDRLMIRNIELRLQYLENKAAGVEAIDDGSRRDPDRPI